MPKEHITLTTEEERDLDLLIARLEYLCAVSNARRRAQRAIEQQFNTEITTEELDRLLITGELPS